MKIQDKYCKECKDALYLLFDSDEPYMCVRVFKKISKSIEVGDYSVSVDCPYLLEMVIENENRS